jgi:hypothetical protein
LSHTVTVANRAIFQLAHVSTGVVTPEILLGGPFFVKSVGGGNDRRAEKMASAGDDVRK